MSSDSGTLDIKIQDEHGSQHHIRYSLCDNPIAVRWYRKIRHLQRLPLDENYTSRVKSPSVDELQWSMREDISLLRGMISLDYPLKTQYHQQDFNYLHSLTLSTQYNYPKEVRNIFHRMHRTLHLLEQKQSEYYVVPRIHAGWGEQEGLLEEKFDINPYQFYQSMKPGNIYLVWAEFGKTPYDYWRDKDIDDAENFIENCRVHKTFRAQFSLSVREINEKFDDGFTEWFENYKQI